MSAGLGYGGAAGAAAPPPAYALLGILGLLALGITQPLLDLLGRSPEFLVARGLGGAAVLALVAGVWLLPAVLLGLAGGGVARATGRHAPRVWGAVLAIAALPFAALVSRRLPLPGWAALAAAVGLAVATGIAAVRAPRPARHSPSSASSASSCRSSSSPAPRCVAC